MPRMMIDVPATIKEQIAVEVAEGGFDDAGSYLARLVREERKRKARAKVEELVEEAFRSGDASPMTPADWEQRRRNLQKRLAESNGASPKTRQAPRR